MLIRIFIRYYKLIIFILIPISIQAEESNNSINGVNNSVINKIDDLFLIQSTKKNVIWTPKINGKSKYAFSIPKDAYLISKNHADASDLFYLSEQIDSGLKLHPNKSKNIDILLLGNNSNLILSQRILPDTNVGLFFKKKEKISFGVNLNKDVIITKNTFGNFGFVQAKDEDIIFNAKFVKLSNNEKSEFYGNINHEFKSDHLNVGLSNTWFDIANQFDLTLGIQEQDKKVESEFYTSFGNETMKLQIGFDQIKNKSNMNMFFNLKFENILNKKSFGTNIIISSKGSAFGLKKLSLKSFRRKNLDKLWKKNMNYN